MEKFCNIEVFYKKGERKTFLNASRHDRKNYIEDENVVLVLAAYKVYKTYAPKEFLYSHLDIYIKSPNGSYEKDCYEIEQECDDPVYLFAQKKIHEELAQKEDLEKRWKNVDGEYVSPSARAALE